MTDSRQLLGGYSPTRPLAMTVSGWGRQLLIMRLSLLVLSILTLTTRIQAIPVPNGQLGNVEIECGETTIEAVFLTEALFEGRIFVIGHAHDPNCVSRDIGRRTTSILINKDACGVVTTRSSDPNGLFSTVKIMISFHNDFITKVDRGYEISCFYMAGDKTVTYPITVNTPSLAGITEIAEMPRCRYEVIEPESQEPAEVVTVGSKLLHKWTCESTAPNLWCMRVHTCRVEDGSGTEFQILDERGCSIDRYLLDNLEYSGDLAAQKEAHAFKFADKVVVNFQCSVRLDIKDGECPIPQCEDPLRAELARKSAAAVSGQSQTQFIPQVRRQPTVAPVVQPQRPAFSGQTGGNFSPAPVAVTPRPQQPTSRRPSTRNPIHPVFKNTRKPRHSGFAEEIPIENSSSSIEVDVRSQQIDVLDPIFGSEDSAIRATELRRLRRHQADDCIPKGMAILAVSSSLALITILIATVIVLFLRPNRKF